MNKISFAVAAVYGASVAKASCQATLPLPDQSTADKMALAEANFAYMDACATDGQVTWAEYEALVGATGEGGADRAENVRKYQMIDLNNDNSISLVELLQAYRVKYNPIDLQNSLPPFDQVRQQIFDYLRCPPKASTDPVQDCQRDGYTREDLKAVIALLYPLHNIIDDYPAFEAYVDHEMALRDFDKDGKITQFEQGRYDHHYKTIRSYWNQSKGNGESSQTIPNDGNMTWDQFNQQDNMLLNRDFPNGIPDIWFQRRFWSIDRDRDGELSWWEYWSQQQEDAVGYYNFIQRWEQLNSNDDIILTRDEVTAYYEDQGLTSAEVATKVQEFYDKYNLGEKDGTGDDIIDKHREMWMLIHWKEEEMPNRAARRRQRQSYNFDKYHWYTLDSNRDHRWSYNELIVSMNDVAAQEIFTMLGKDPNQDELTYEEVKQLVQDIEWKYEYTHDHREPIAISDFNTASPGKWRKFGAADEAELIDILENTVDKDGDGILTYNEVCRYFVHDSGFFCKDDPADNLEMVQSVKLPDFYQPSPFEMFWAQFDASQMNPEQNQIEQANFRAAVSGVDAFSGLTDAEIDAQFSVYDMNGDGIVTIDEAQHVFSQPETVQQVTERVQEIYESNDTNMDSKLDETEFLASVNTLEAIGLIPETDTSEVLDVYDYVLEKYNETAVEQVEVVPTSAVLVLMKDVTAEAWTNFVQMARDN